MTGISGLSDRPIRVAHFSFADSDGGAAKAAYRLHSALRAQGVDGRLHVLKKGTDDSSVVSVTAHARFGTLASELSPRIDLLPMKIAHPNARTFWSPGWYGSVDPLKLPGVADADVLCLYWVTRGLLSVRQIQRLLATGKPVVWRLSDMWPFTGGCHYSEGCDGYDLRCGNCPQLGSKYSRDLSRRMLTEKVRRWAQGNLTVVAPSHWIASAARSSSVFASRDIQVIATGVDQEIFRPLDKRHCRELLGLPPGMPLVLFGATSALSDARKGGDLMSRALRLVSDAISAENQTVGLVLFGTSTRPSGLPNMLPVFPLGTVRDELLLPAIFSACDVFLAPSREENLANSVLEAMACGLPTVAFAVGGMLDAIVHNETGLLINPGDEYTLAAGITSLILDERRRAMLGTAARARALTHFSARLQAGKYLQLFRALLK